MSLGLGDIGKRLDVWVNQVEDSTTNEYRAQVEGLFNYILETTPQASGRAVANWKIGINQPDNSYDPAMGDQPDIATNKGGEAYHRRIQFRQKGDKKWIGAAQDEQLYKLQPGTSRNSKNRLKLGDTVYITNNVVGDDGKYLDRLQGDWSGLRDANKPYVTAAEALLIYSWQGFADGGSTHLDKFI